jgi:hypothetical protein
MAKRSWTFDLDPAALTTDGPSILPRKITHNIDLTHNYWTNRRVIRLDGERISRERLWSYGVYAKGSDDLFVVDGWSCYICIRSDMGGYTYDFAVGGRSVTTGELLIPWPETREIAQHQIVTGERLYTSWWVWLGLPAALFITVMGSLQAASVLREYQIQSGVVLHPLSRLTEGVIGLSLVLSFTTYSTVARMYAVSGRWRILIGLLISALWAVGSFFAMLIVGFIFH